MPSGQDYTSRLREETRRTLATHIHDLEKELRNFQADLSTALGPIAQKLGSILQIEIPAAEAIVSDAVAGEAREGGQRRTEEMLELARFACNMRHKETQDEILNALLDGAHRYAPRLALFVTRGNQFLGWASRGFAEETALKLSQSAFAFSDCSLLRGSLEADGLTTAGDLSQETVLSRLLPSIASGPMHAFPMKAIGRPVAVLLALPAEGASCDLEPICILMEITGLCVENLALKILHEMNAAKTAAPVPAASPADAEPQAAAAPAAVADAPEDAPQEAAPASAAEVLPAFVAPPDLATEYAGEATPEPIIPVESVIETAPLEPIVTTTVASEETVLETVEPAEVCQDLAARTMEEPAAETPAMEPAPPIMESIAEETSVPVLEAHEPARTTVLREVQPLTEEERLHADAKRFARLLATEIKLYNEQRVTEGRSNRDIYVRLKRDIDRSRDMYEKRVSPLVSRRVDYFHDEIIRVLGDNDPSTLGSDYPGPRVES
jgi:hypothetical protein